MICRYHFGRIGGKRLLSFSARRGVVGLLLAALLGAPLTRAVADGPISEDELLALVTTANIGAVTSDRVVELIRERGIGFSVKDILLQELNAREAHPAIIRAVQESRLKSQPKSATTPSFEAEPPPPLVFSPAAEPKPPPPTAPVPATPAVLAALPDGKSWPEFLEEVRSMAMEYTENLPNFICTQITQRFVRRLPKKGWVRMDNFVAELTYNDKREKYRLLSVANRAAAEDATLDSLHGSTSTGEFGSKLNFLFDPETKALFRLEGIDHSRGSPTIRVGFRVPKDTSKRGIVLRDSVAEQMVITPYRGRCWVDPTSLQVVKIEERAFRIPAGFPITRSEGSTEYDLVEISDRKYWLPVRAEVLLENRPRRVHTRNVIEFKRYRKFGSEVKFLTD